MMNFLQGLLYRYFLRNNAISKTFRIGRTFYISKFIQRLEGGDVNRRRYKYLFVTNQITYYKLKP